MLNVETIIGNLYNKYNMNNPIPLISVNNLENEGINGFLERFKALFKDSYHLALYCPVCGNNPAEFIIDKDKDWWKNIKRLFVVTAGIIGITPKIFKLMGNIIDNLNLMGNFDDLIRNADVSEFKNVINEMKDILDSYKTISKQSKDVVLINTLKSLTSDLDIPSFMLQERHVIFVPFWFFDSIGEYIQRKISNKTQEGLRKVIEEKIESGIIPWSKHACGYYVHDECYDVIPREIYQGFLMNYSKLNAKDIMKSSVDERKILFKNVKSTLKMKSERVAIKIICIGHDNKKILQEAIDLLNSTQEAYDYQIISSTFFKDYIEKEYYTADLYPLMTNIYRKKLGFKHLLVGWVTKQLNGKKWHNLFNSIEEDERKRFTGNSIFSTSGVESMIKPIQLKVYLIFELLSLAIRLSYGTRRIHMKPKDCIFSFKEDKETIIEIMKSGKVCNNCFKELSKRLDDDKMNALGSTIFLIRNLSL